MPSDSIENYLKSIYIVHERDGKVSTKSLAERMGVAPASATGMIKKLAELNLARHTPYRGVELTEAGRRMALEVLRHHRLLELYLHEALGVPWDRVHEEAEKLEHVLSEELEARIDAWLGHPTLDPHGAPIPAPDGSLPVTPPRRLLSEAAPGDEVVVACVCDASSEFLRFVGELGLYPGTTLRVAAVGPIEGSVTIEVGGVKHDLPGEAAGRIVVRSPEKT
ncbi:MAG: metal-dependent transcriptional regulator [Candidatus Sumerlaeia bacterium]